MEEYEYSLTMINGERHDIWYKGNFGQLIGHINESLFRNQLLIFRCLSGADKAFNPNHIMTKKNGDK